MKVILLQNIEKLGKKGEVKDIPKGYARNFLIPKNMVVLATESEIEKTEQELELEAQQAEEELIRSQEMAQKVDGLELEISTKVGEDGKLFGAINETTISSKLKEMGFKIEKEEIKLEEPIKEIGEYDVRLELPHNLEISIKIIVSAEKKE